VDLVDRAADPADIGVHPADPAVGLVDHVVGRVDPAADPVDRVAGHLEAAVEVVGAKCLATAAESIQGTMLLVFRTQQG